MTDTEFSYNWHKRLYKIISEMIVKTTSILTQYLENYIKALLISHLCKQSDSLHQVAVIPVIIVIDGLILIVSNVIRQADMIQDILFKVFLDTFTGNESINVL